MEKSNNSSCRSISRRIVVALLICCLMTGMAAVTTPVFGASSFSKAAPFSGTSSSYTHNARYSGNLIVNGVDVSYWQSTSTKWATAKKKGVDFAILRVSYTNYGPSSLKLNLDTHFETLYKNAKANGLMTGVYVFSQALSTTEARKEADYAVKRLKALGIGPEDLNLPVYMDYEFAGGIFGRMHGLTRTAATNSAVAFCNRIKSYGYTPGIYANTTFFSDYLDVSKFADDVDLWCAQYYSHCTSSVDYSKWQYSSSAKITGIPATTTGKKGNTDVNFWYLNKKAAKKTITKICGKTTLSVADAKNPKFKIYDGDKLLKAGRDYNVGGIRNNAKGTGYAYIKGIGKYGGYALVPITIADETKGKASAKISNSKIANYMTYASKAVSKYIKVKAYATPTTIKKLKTRKQAFYVKVAKQKKAHASGYQVKYSRRSDMEESVTKYIGKKYTKVGKKIKTNARQMYYYVQVRTYKDYGGQRYYSAWSTVKKVWVK